VFKEIITTDPHAYNALQNEYPKLGIVYPVKHYTQFLAERIDMIKPKLSHPLEVLAAFHDPCYLGRVNGNYDEPRLLLEAIPGLELVELSHAFANSPCCGAGGGRIWMEEGSIEERPSEMRIREATNMDDISTMIVTCPKDVTMYLDAVKTTGSEKKIEVKDLIELVAEAV